MYTKHVWTHEEIITRQNLNHMEEGIFNNAKAIDEFIAPTIITKQLPTGTTYLTFTNDRILTATSINLLTTDGIAPISQSVNGNTYRVDFEAQNSDIDVRIEIR